MRQQFDGFELDREQLQIFREGLPVPLERRALDLLLYFIENPRRLIERQELVTGVWRARALSEGVLASTVAKLRKAIGQASDARAPLETVRGRGYRWHSAAPSVADRFVARAAPLAQLLEALEHASAGHGQLALVAGDAGMGKTRLLRELEQRALARGFSAWWGSGYDAAATPAYWPWVEVLRGACLQLSAAAFRSHLPAQRAAIEQLVPELCGCDPSASSAQAQRFALMDELAGFLAACGRSAPRLIFLDDLHWADAASWELLGYLSQALSRSRVLMVTALRENELARSEASQRLQRHALHIVLEGLQRADVAELVAALCADRAADASFVNALFERTQGNPLFVRETLRWLGQQPGSAVTETPPLVRGVIERRIALLPEQTRRVLAAASVVGADFDACVIAELLELPLERVVRALEAALHARVVERSEHDGQAEYVFTHALLRDALYAALGRAASGALHARLAHALIRRGAAADVRALTAIAHHFLLALPSELSASVRYGRAAAAAARASAGFDAAAALLCRVVHQHEQQSDDLVERCELLLELAHDLQCAGDIRASWRAAQRGAQLAQKLGAAQLSARFALALAPWLEFGGGDEAYVLKLQAHALEQLAERAPELRARLLAQRARWDSEHPLPVRLGWLDEADALALQVSDAGLARELASARALMRAPLRLHESRQAVARFQALDAAHNRSGFDPIALQRSLCVELVAYSDALAAGDLATAHAALDRGRVFARDAQVMGCDFLLDMVDAGRALAAGRLTELELCVLRLRDHSRGGGGFSLAWMRYRALLGHERGALDMLLHVPAEQIASHAELPRHQRKQGDVFLAWLFANLQANARARRYLADVAQDWVERLPMQRDDLGTMCMLAEVYVHLGDRAGAERLLEQLSPYHALNAIGPTFEYLGSVAHFMGELAVLLGHLRHAEGLFEQAEALNLQLDMPRQLERTRSARAELR